MSAHESTPYTFEKEIAQQSHKCLSDRADQQRLRSGPTNAVLRSHAIDTVFQAAARKHVPLMELYLCKAIKNNVRGTCNLVAAAAENV
jgi:FlaA1/EpsC-like NDP-sugar epimerase